jgi:hypothetical protein
MTNIHYGGCDASHSDSFVFANMKYIIIFVRYHYDLFLQGIIYTLEAIFYIINMLKSLCWHLTINTNILLQIFEFSY